MENNIPEIHISRKSKDFLVIALIILLGTLSFGMGRLSNKKETTPQIALCDQAKVNTILSSTSSSTEGVVDTETTETGSYVGSKNGTVYHLPWCSGAKRISDENKVWFASKEEAEARGYRPAVNCKGI